jgi:molecular chaperone DnaK (HSP70)
MRLGIDFGTTRTVIAAVRDGRYPVATFQTPEGFVEFLPGLASVEKEGLRFGTEADTSQSATGELHGLVRSVKETVTGLAPDETVCKVHEADVSALDLVTSYLSYVRRMLVSHSNLDLDPEEPLEAMVAVPAHASTRQRYLTIEAFSRAGFSVLGLLNEPTAAAIEFARHTLSALSTRSPKRYVVVYDLGGGTFDTAAVSLVDRRFELIGSEGISRLGGNDFDEIIAERALAALGVERRELSSTAATHLLERCRIAKEGLTATSRRLLIDTSGILPRGPEQVVVDLQPIYDACEPLIERTLAQCDRLFRDLRMRGIDPDNSRELGAVYLVGGSVLFPAVQRALRRKYGRKVQLAPQPHATTAIGLCIAADDDAGIFVREAPTRHFGVWRESDAGREKVFDAIIEKRADVRVDGPLRVVRTYFPAHTVGLLRFVECTHLDAGRQPTGDVTPWENVFFPYDPALENCSDLGSHMKERDPEELGQEIVETYEYSATGMIRVRIENRTAGYKREYVLGRGAA